jgi:hypothetical protein
MDGQKSDSMTHIREQVRVESPVAIAILTIVWHGQRGRNLVAKSRE